MLGGKTKRRQKVIFILKEEMNGNLDVYSCFFSFPMHAALVFSLGNSLNLKKNKLFSTSAHGNKTQTEFFVRFTSQLNVFDLIKVDCLVGHGSQRCKMLRMEKRLQIRQVP